MQVSSNIIILLAKRHIYRCKVRNGIPSLNLFKSGLKNYILSEKCYASTSDTMIKFTRKWNSFAAFWRTVDHTTYIQLYYLYTYFNLLSVCHYFVILYWLSTYCLCCFFVAFSSFFFFFSFLYVFMVIQTHTGKTWTLYDFFSSLTLPFFIQLH